MTRSYNEAVNHGASGARLPWVCDLIYDLKICSDLVWEWAKVGEWSRR